ncbi:hypothetical protein MIMGU_mgv1a021589mg [Erythranthe guttata]|uniref:non-specific serine/threonine protein kinase n=1 Tax=Erythranthe guttata TaxID=4155 RepID=A0A022Q4H5_ERYGU|nr:hypothetical protein MIMGU_mgv1a021589mg [Erythranthe guttata]
MSSYCLISAPVKYPTTLETDKSALLAPKSHITLDPHNILAQNWTNSSSVCSWIGITCGLRHNRVTAVNLSYMGLSGTIPPQLGNLSFLVSLDFSFNLFTDYLPKLEHLSLRNNNFTGFIPSSVSNPTNLQFLDFSSNSLQGVIPQELGKLHNLKNLYMEYNHLSGRIPSSIFNMSDLKAIAFTGNELIGSLPSVIPFEIGNLQNLAQFASIGNLSTSLQNLFAYNCKIKGIIPPDIGNLSSLVTLSLFENELSGNIPPTVSHMHKLQGLGLHRNNLRGSIPEGLCDLEKLVVLSLSQNNFFGRIPECLGNITSLRYLHLDSNMLTSSIPSSMWHLTNFLYLNLSSNSLSGFIPPEIGNLVSANTIDLSMNHLSDSIPSTIGNLISLSGLSLAHNLLEGSIPESMGNMISLVYIDLSYNNLSGEIPNGGPFENFTIESFKGNDALCGIPRFNVPLCNHNVSKHKSRMKRARLALFIVIGVVAFISLLSLTFIFVRYRRKHKAINGIDGLVPTVPPERISYYELLQATEQFSETNLLGVGSFGSVYKAALRDGKIFAVKVFNALSEAASKSFEVECEVLRNIRHRNLTKVISSCSNEDFKALVLEYMPNGNLEKWLYSHNYCLDLMQRLNIMIDAACALEYLHHGYSTLIVHCDLKPSNVLLDEEMVAHVSDFGIAKLMGEGESSVHTNTLATMGYIAPVNISYMGLSGTIPPQLGNLSFLVSLDFSFNLFGGALPQPLSLLHRLKFISFRVNKLSGEIPRWLDL